MKVAKDWEVPCNEKEVEDYFGKEEAKNVFDANEPKEVDVVWVHVSDAQTILAVDYLVEVNAIVVFRIQSNNYLH